MGVLKLTHERAHTHIKKTQGPRSVNRNLCNGFEKWVTSKRKESCIYQATVT